VNASQLLVRFNNGRPPEAMVTHRQAAVADDSEASVRAGLDRAIQRLIEDYRRQVRAETTEHDQACQMKPLSAKPFTIASGPSTIRKRPANNGMAGGVNRTAKADPRRSRAKIPRYAPVLG
jgi:hypothetical protein